LESFNGENIQLIEPREWSVVKCTS